MANSIKIWKTVERRIGGPFKFCNSTPLWHNFNFVCGNRPFVQPSWSSLGVNTCGDIYDNQGLCSFQTLRAKFCLPASAYFVFLQLRSALKVYGVPWSSSISSHPMRDWIAPSAGRPSVSLIYNTIIDCITKPLSIKTIWNKKKKLQPAIFSQRPTIGFPRRHFNSYWTSSQSTNWEPPFCNHDNKGTP